MSLQRLVEHTYGWLVAAHSHVTGPGIHTVVCGEPATSLDFFLQCTQTGVHFVQHKQSKGPNSYIR